MANMTAAIDKRAGVDRRFIGASPGEGRPEIVREQVARRATNPAAADLLDRRYQPIPLLVERRERPGDHPC
jgi:hypothetical protein